MRLRCTICVPPSRDSSWVSELVLIMSLLFSRAFALNRWPKSLKLTRGQVKRYAGPVDHATVPGPRLRSEPVES